VARVRERDAGVSAGLPFAADLAAASARRMAYAALRESIAVVTPCGRCSAESRACDWRVCSVSAFERLHRQDGVQLDCVRGDAGLAVVPVEEHDAGHADLEIAFHRPVPQHMHEPPSRRACLRENARALHACRIGELDDHRIAVVISNHDVQITVILVSDVDNVAIERYDAPLCDSSPTVR